MTIHDKGWARFYRFIDAGGPWGELIGIDGKELWRLSVLEARPGSTATRTSGGWPAATCPTRCSRDGLGAPRTRRRALSRRPGLHLRRCRARELADRRPRPAHGVRRCVGSRLEAAAVLRGLGRRRHCWTPTKSSAGRSRSTTCARRPKRSTRSRRCRAAPRSRAIRRPARRSGARSPRRSNARDRVARPDCTPRTSGSATATSRRRSASPTARAAARRDAEVHPGRPAGDARAARVDRRGALDPRPVRPRLRAAAVRRCAAGRRRAGRRGARARRSAAGRRSRRSGRSPRSTNGGSSSCGPTGTSPGAATCSRVMRSRSSTRFAALVRQAHHDMRTSPP